MVRKFLGLYLEGFMRKESMGVMLVLWIVVIHVLVSYELVRQRPEDNLRNVDGLDDLFADKKDNGHKEQSNDRISNLPDAITDHILSFLPIKSIAQTSVLSKRWRYIWSSFPSLDFSESQVGFQIGNLSTNLHYPETKALEFISLVLARCHKRSNIQSFHFKGDLSLSCLYDCICSVVKHKVVELELDVCLNYHFDMPRYLFTCDSLRTLMLKARKPSTTLGNQKPSFRFLTSYAIAANGLQSLCTLSLTCIRFMDGQMIADLFSASCFPLLKELKLSACEGVTYLCISYPNLENFTVRNMQIYGLDVSGRRLERLQVCDCFHNSCIITIFAPHLQKNFWELSGFTEKFSAQNFAFLHLASFYIHKYTKSAANVRSTETLLSGLSNTTKLYVGFRYIEILSEIHFAGGLPFSFDKLLVLMIHTGLGKCDIPGVCCLLRSCPKVRALRVDIFNNWGTQTDNRDFLDNADLSEEEYWESQTQVLRSCLNHLVWVKIVVRGQMIHENAINFVKFLLKHGSVLGKILLSVEREGSVPNENLPLQELKIHLLKEFYQASSDVDIVLG
ncbi:hypothetical protein L1049_019358 [Liquidambar formosana]|uniref:F-box domain-containing protein n=1 Tax=Liquidambar formosana TaxID=63359 RepID=A0AAP0S5K8_LIQFO